MGEIELFRAFASAEDLQDTLKHFETLLQALRITQHEFVTIYPALKSSVSCNEARTLFRLLDKRAAQTPYDGGRACKGKKVLVIGAGPCGLRMAIEASLLGAQVTVLEMRDHILRNNILHLWPSVIHDLKTIGGKVFFPKFCSGNREHISIRRLQNILVKLALVSGVQIFAPVSFQTLKEPKPGTNGHGWRVTVSPSGHPVEKSDFDIIVGADGRRNSLRVFKRILFRGKLALGVTANFVNEQKNQDHQIEELGGVIKIFKPEFFAKLKRKGDVDLENFVYFKNDTHYFVCTPKKDCLIRKGILRKDTESSRDLLAPNNVDKSKLEEFVHQVAHIATDGQLDNRSLALNHNGDKDVAIFDFTALHKADHSCMAVERHGKKLLLAIVGDTLIEPFWPTGSGAGRGFLSVFDTAWLMKHWCEGIKTPLEAIAEREGVYKILSQTGAQNLSTNLSKYTIDPDTRYSRSLRWSPMHLDTVRHLYRTEALSEWAQDAQVTEVKTNTPTFRMGMMGQGKGIKEDLLDWYRKELTAYKDRVSIRDLSTSWGDGIALLCLLNKYRPELIDVKELDPTNSVGNVNKAFKYFENAFGVSPALSAAEFANPSPDRLAILTYLVQLKGSLMEDHDSGKKVAMTPERKAVIKRKLSAVGMLRQMSKKSRKSWRGVQPSRRLATASHEGRSHDQKAPPLPKKPGKQTVPDTFRPPRIPPRRPLSNVVGTKFTGTLDRCQQKQLAKSRIKDWENIASPNRQTAPSWLPSSTLCAMCGKGLLLADRQNVQGYFVHRTCFKCSTCQEALWPAEATADPTEDESVSFTCPRHRPGAKLDEDVLDSIDNNVELEESDSDSSDEEMETENNNDMSLSAWMGAMMLQQDRRESVDGMHKMAGRNNLHYVAVGEEESEEDDNTAGEDTLRCKKRTLYSLVTSVQLMLGHHIQQELGEAESEAEELEGVGIQMENALRDSNKKAGGLMSNMEEEVQQEFLQLMDERRKLQKRQSKLLLKAKMLELQKRHSQLADEMNSLQRHIECTDGTDDEREDVSLEKIDVLNREMSDVEKMAQEIQVFFKDAGETAI